MGDFALKLVEHLARIGVVLEYGVCWDGDTLWLRLNPELTSMVRDALGKVKGFRSCRELVAKALASCLPRFLEAPGDVLERLGELMAPIVAPERCMGCPNWSGFRMGHCPGMAELFRDVA